MGTRRLSPLLAVSLLCAGVSAVSAHSDLVQSEPGSGAVVGAAPPSVDLTFNEPLLDGSTATVLDAGFQIVSAGPASRDVRDATRLSIALGDLPPGTYNVQWRAVNVDGDITNGTYPFTIDPAAAHSPGDVLSSAGLLATLLIGGAVCVWIIRRQGTPRPFIHEEN